MKRKPEKKQPIQSPDIVESPELRGRVDELIHEGRFLDALKTYHKNRRGSSDEEFKERNKR
jgi:hypothetical protein